MEMIQNFLEEYGEMIAKLIADIKAFMEKLKVLLTPAEETE